MKDTRPLQKGKRNFRSRMLPFATGYSGTQGSVKKEQRYRSIENSGEIKMYIPQLGLIEMSSQ